jgi:hypothetical protein
MRTGGNLVDRSVLARHIYKEFVLANYTVAQHQK